MGEKVKVEVKIDPMDGFPVYIYDGRTYGFMCDEHDKDRAQHVAGGGYMPFPFETPEIDSCEVVATYEVEV